MIRSRLLLSVLVLLSFCVLPGLAQEHFTPVDPTGLPYSIVVESAMANGAGLIAGDEVAVFDGAMCVGAAEVTGDWPLALTAWEGDDNLNLDGFDAGKPMLFKVWQAGSNTQTNGLGDYMVGNGKFGTGFGAQVNVVAMTGNVQFNIWCPDSEVPAQGGSLNVGVQIWSSLGVTNPGVAFWTFVTSPGGQTYGPLTVIPFTHTPFMSVINDGLNQVIPNTAPAGTYTYTAHVGLYPNALLTDTFTFTKVGATAADPGEMGRWPVEGDLQLAR